jgi:exoribonuclease II
MILVCKSLYLFVPMLGVNLLELRHLYALQQAPAAERSVNLSGDGTLWAQIVIFLTTVLTLIYQVYVRHADWKEKQRQREWDVEDRRLAREEARARAEEAARSVKHELDQQTRTVVKEHRELRAAIDENTTITAAAALKAASAEQRIADLRAMFEGDASETLGRIEENTEETVDRLRSSEEKGAKDDASPGSNKRNG